MLAALAVTRELGVPLTARGGGTSVAGNAVGTGVVLDFSRHVNRILEIDPDARTARIEPGVVMASLQKAAAPHGLRFGPDPSHAGARDARRDDRQQRLRAARGRLRADRRQRARARRGRRHRPPVRGPVGRRCARRRAGSRRPGPRPPRRPPDRARPLRPAGLRLLPRAPAAREGHRPGQGAGRHRGDGRARCSARPCAWCRSPPRPCSSCSATPTCRRPPTPSPRCSRTRRWRSRAWTRGWSTWSVASAVPPPCPPLPAGRRLAHGRGGRRRPRRGAGPGAARSRRPPGTDAVGLFPPGPEAAAMWRIREDGAGLGRPHPVGRAGVARLRGLGRPARAARRLPARARGAHGRRTASTAWRTGTSATAACTCASTSRWSARATRCARS